MSKVTTEYLKDEMAMFNVAYLSAMNDFIDRIKKLPTHEYREYDGHDEVVIRECVYVSDIMNMLNNAQISNNDLCE